jgi:hypothetical protein
MEFEQHVIIKFLSTKEVSAPEIEVRLRKQYGEETYSTRTVYHWIQQFRLGRTMIEDEKRYDCPPIDDVDALVLEHFNKNPFHTVLTLAGSLG